ncbi:MAG: phenylalanine--tRNA ligase subunit beta [Chloroflexota bacterium]
MKVPGKWLQEYVPVTVPLDELTRRLTSAGLETMALRTGGAWANVVIGVITAVNPHPNADRLRLATVDLGTEQETVVCGAPNLNAGDKIAFARVGAELIDPYKNEKAILKPAKIRGVESRGMICSEKELGISDSHEGILVLTPEAPLGKPLADYLSDVVLNADITPNRADCLSVIGIAREVAALTGQQPDVPEITYPETEGPVKDYISIEIADPALCPRYCASLITDVKIGDSPPWMQERLIACGMRPINNIVDITNYVMMEYGQPLHAFDHRKIRDAKIRVRPAYEGETIESLDGVERELSPDMLVIADLERPIAIAGVMGGANSEVLGNTTTILLESASFNPASIHYTSRKLLLTSEASMRFERGIQPGVTLPALGRATQLMIEFAGGKAATGIMDVYPGRKEPETIPLSPKEVERILGMPYSTKEITQILESLGFTVTATGKTPELLVTVPYWRGDVRREIDLIEEVARIGGYDRIPTTLLAEPLPHQDPQPLLTLREELQQRLLGYGFQETLSFSLAGMDTLKKLHPEMKEPEPLPLRVANPMTAEQEYLRPTLRPGLLGAINANRRHEEGNLRFFEMGKVFLAHGKDLPDEVEVLCAVLGGSREESSWRGEAAPLDFFDVKGMVEGLLARPGSDIGFVPGEDASLHPARQAAVTLGGEQIGVLGELHPKVAQAFEITEPVFLFEINVSALLTHAAGTQLFQSIPRFPGIVRDLALVLAETVTHQQVASIVEGFPLVKECRIFDVYSGKQVPPGKKSLAYHIIYQSPDHTLTDAEVDRVQEKILKKLEHVLGATLRAG